MVCEVEIDALSLMGSGDLLFYITRLRQLQGIHLSLTVCWRRRLNYWTKVSHTKIWKNQSRRMSLDARLDRGVEFKSARVYGLRGCGKFKDRITPTMCTDGM